MYCLCLPTTLPLCVVIVKDKIPIKQGKCAECSYCGQFEGNGAEKSSVETHTPLDLMSSPLGEGARYTVC